MIIEKCVNIPIIYKSFINICKNSAVKTIKTSAKIIVIITLKNKVMQNALTCQVIITKKINIKICKTFPVFLRYFEKGFLWTLRGITPKMAKNINL